ncbi:MAG TPA: hypothetical protein VHE35_07730, partial [Kofleriaceae bacterium]|nr:hypothetical protein [Kofleriaceae bacterium]
GGSGGGGGGGGGRRRFGGGGRDELDQRPWGDDVPTYDADADLKRAADDPFVPGAQVRHAAFGVGRVVETRGSGFSRRVVVDFAAVGAKTIDPRWLVAT